MLELGARCCGFHGPDKATAYPQLAAASSLRLMSTSSQAIRAKVIPVYRAILRELYQAVRVIIP